MVATHSKFIFEFRLAAETPGPAGGCASVALFHLNIHRQGEVTPDPDGQGLGSFAEAYDAAICGIRGILCDDLVSTGRIDLSGSIEIVSDAEGHMIDIPFHEALEPPGSCH
jgi:hypothetical protein